MIGAGTLITLPVKDPVRAKQRLSGVLTAEARADLVLGLFRRNLAIIRQSAPGAAVLVVTSSPVVAAIASEYGAHVQTESTPLGLNGAVSLATSWALMNSVRRHLILHADIACLDGSELQTLLALELAPPAIALCPADDGGTNALMMCPPGVLEPSYGLHSAAAHIREAQAKDIAVTSLKLENMAFDIDTPEDYARFSAGGGLKAAAFKTIKQAS